jgi:uncharacterized protein (TIGR00251 family)
MRKYKMHDGKVGSALAVRLTPKASRNAIVGIQEDGTVKVHVTAPPEGGQDNEALLSILSEVLEVPTKNVAIVAGESGRDKLLSILGMDAVTLTTILRNHLA